MIRPTAGVGAEGMPHGGFIVTMKNEVFFDISKLSGATMLHTLRKLPPDRKVLRRRGRIYCPADHVRKILVEESEGEMREKVLRAFDAMVKKRREDAIAHIAKSNPLAVARRAAKRLKGFAKRTS